MASWAIGNNLIVIIKGIGLKPLEIMPSKICAIIYFLPMSILFYFVFIHSKRYLRIIEHYSEETKQQHKKGNLLLITYLVATFAALLFL